MPTFVFTSPDGKEYEVEGPEGSTQQQAWQQLQKQLRESKPAETTKPPAENRAYTFGRGVVQGALYDPVEGIGQLIEHAANIKLPVPQTVRKWLRDVRDETERTGTGTAGRLTGAVGSLFAAPEIAGLARAAQLARAARAMTPAQQAARIRQIGTPAASQLFSARAQALGKPVMSLTNEERSAALLGHPPPGAARAALSFPARAATGAAVAAAEPVEGSPEDYLQQKGYQALAGGTLGGLAGSALAQRAGAVRPLHWHWHYPFSGYGLYHLAGPWGLGAGAGTLATLAALARGGGARSVAALGGGAGEAVGQVGAEAPRERQEEQNGQDQEAVQ
jgi:hypothetical protein